MEFREWMVATQGSSGKPLRGADSWQRDREERSPQKNRWKAFSAYYFYVLLIFQVMKHIRQGWLVQGAQWSSGTFFSWRHIWLRACIFSYYVMLPGGHEPLIKALLDLDNATNKKQINLRSDDRGLIWVPTVGSHSSSPEFQTWVVHTQNLQKEGEATFKNIHLICFIYLNPIKQEQLQINE